MKSLRVTHGRVVGGCERGDRGSGRVRRRWLLLKRRSRHLVLHVQHLRSSITGRRVVVPGHQRWRRHGDAGVRQRDGGGPGSHVFVLDRVQSQLIAGHRRGRVDGRVRVGGGMRPWIVELRRVVVMVHVALVDVIETHTAVLAVLILNDHRHGE